MTDIYKNMNKVNLKQFTLIYNSNYEDVPLDTTLLVWDGCEWDTNFVKVCGDTGRKYPAGGYDFIAYMVLEDELVAEEYFEDGV